MTLAVEIESETAALPTERLEAELCQLAAHISAATCRWLLMVAEYDRRGAWASWECRSCAHWLSLKTGLGLHAARQHVRVARRLGDLPEITRAFSEGRLSFSKVRSLVRIANPAIEKALVGLARYATASQLDRLGRAMPPDPGTDDDAGGSHLDLGPGVLAETARRLACDASLLEAVTDGDGVPLDIGRKTQQVPTSLRRALHLRDHRCRFPGCTNKFSLDAHHIQHWAKGGATALDNLVLLCRHHHRAVHEGPWNIECGPDGLIRFTKSGQFVRDSYPVAASHPAAVEEINNQAGLTIDPQTGGGNRTGERLNLRYAVDTLTANRDVARRKRNRGGDGASRADRTSADQPA